MAKKQNFETLDEFGFDKDMDLGDMDFDLDPPPDNRSAITKAGHGVLQGAKDTVFSNNFVMRFMRKALPKGYGDALDMSGEIAGNLKTLYHNSAKDLKPAVNELKRTTQRVLPQLGSKVPKSLAEKLDSWAKSAEEQQRGMSPEEMREAGLSLQMAEVFKAQAVQGAKEKAEATIKDGVKAGIEENRHKDMFGLLNNIGMNTSRLVSYQDKINANFQRKSLELQYRQYFVMADLLEEQKKNNEEAKLHLKEIVKNTGLPDYVKLNQSEALKEAMRNRFIGAAQDGISNMRRKYFNGVQARIQKAMQQKVKDFGSGIEQGLMGVNSMLDAQEMMKDMGGDMSMAEMGGSMVGSSAANKFGNWMGGKAGKYLDNSKYGSKIRKVGTDLEYGAANLPQLLDNWSKTYKGDDLPIIGGLISFLKENMGMQQEDYGMALDNTSNLQAPAPFNGQARKSLTEIIPGYLARIYQELQIIRTGDAGVGLMEYDFTSNKFASSKDRFNSAMKHLVKDSDRSGYKDHANNLMDFLDPDKTLSEEERKILSRYMLNDNMKNMLADPKKYADAFSYSGLKGQQAQKFSGLFEQRFGLDYAGQVTDPESYSRNRLEFSKKFGQLGSNFQGRQEQVQELLNLGYHAELREAGLINDKGEFQKEKLYGYFAGDNHQKSTMGPNTRANRNRKRLHTVGYGDTLSEEAQAENNGKPSTVTMDMKGTETLLDKLLIAVQESNAKVVQESTYNVLARIEHLLVEGNFGMGGQSNMSASQKKRWYDQSIGELGASGMGMAKSGFSWLKGQAGQALGRLKGASNIAKDWLFAKKEEIFDIYIKGEIFPRLVSWKLKAGQYIDVNTGKVIKSLEDITGDVKDLSGEIVIRAEELKDLLNPYGSRFKKRWNQLVGLGQKAWQGAQDLFARRFDFYGQAKAVVMKGIELGKDLFLNGEDVYVKGEENPRLLAMIMRNNGYRSKLTGKVIRRPTKIDGPVVNADGEVVLSEEDLRKGLVDKEGKPLQTYVQQAVGIVKNYAKKAWGFVKDSATKGWNMTKDLFKGLNSPFEFGMTVNGKKTVSVLEQIRDILDARLPKKKRISGDKDGDGMREGSLEDLAKKRSLKDTLKDKGKQLANGLGDKASTMAGMIAALKAKFSKKKGEDGEDEGDEDSALENAIEAKTYWDMAKDGWGGVKKLGKKGAGLVGKAGRGIWGAGKGLAAGALGAGRFGGKMLGGLGRFSGLAAKGLGAAGAVYGATSAYDNLKQGNYGSAALDAGMTGIGLGMTGVGLGSMGSMGMGLLTLGGIISAPVALGALALGGAAYLGYKYMSQKSLDTLSTYRYAQYGFNSKQTDFLQNVFGLEDKLLPFVTHGMSGPKIDESKVEIQDLFKMFGVDPKNGAQVDNWVTWFKDRFKPVFLTHLAALKGVSEKAKLGSVDKDLSDEEKLSYFTKARFSEGPYNISASPFPDLKGLTVSRMEVEALTKITEDALKKGKSAEKKLGEKTAIGAATTLGAALEANTPASNDTASKPGSQDTDAVNFTKVKLDDVANGDMFSVGSTATIIAFKSEKVVSPLNAIRFRTYGLFELDSSKVNALASLEAAVLPNVSIQDGNKAVWKGSINKLLSSVGSSFGVYASNTAESDDFGIWFQARFLPVYLNYLSALNNYTGRFSSDAGVSGLSATQKLELATTIYTSKGMFNGSLISVWDMDVSPWKGYKLNTNKATVNDTLQSLTLDSEKDTLKEKIPTKAANALTASTFDPENKGNKQPGFFASIGNKAKEVMNWVGDKAKALGSGISDAASSVYTSAKDITKRMGESIGFGGGGKVDTSMTGTGGAIDQIPMPKGNGSWAALKDTILAAAKAVGVDGNLMAAMAAVESGFNYSVKAGTSSATGLYQFIKSTWDSMVGKFGAKYGIGSNVSPTDPRANALMGAEFLKQNIAAISPGLNRAPTQTDLYLAHFLGPAGARQFLKADPNAEAASLFPAAAKANTSIFYDKSGRAKTVGEIYGHFNTMLTNKAKSFGLDIATAEMPAGNAAGKPGANDSSFQPLTNVPAEGGKSSSVAQATQGITPSSKSPDMASSPSSGIMPVSEKIPTPINPNVGGPGQGGFTADTMRGARSQVQATQQDFMGAMPAIQDTLQKSLTVQTKSAQLLEQIYQILANGQATAASSSAPAKAMEETPAPQAVPNRMQRPAVNVPVPMRKVAA